MRKAYIPPALFLDSVSDRGGQRKTGYIAPKLYSSKLLYLCLMMYDGLSMRNGRLVNDRPCSTMGIQAAAAARKERLRQEKIRMIEEGVSRAESRENEMESILMMPIRRPY